MRTIACARAPLVDALSSRPVVARGKLPRRTPAVVLSVDSVKFGGRDSFGLVILSAAVSAGSAS